MEVGAGRIGVRFAVVLALALAATLPAAQSAAGSGPSPDPTASPYIVGTQPSDGATAFGQRWLLTATFSEPMNTSSVSVTFVPSVGHGQTWYADEKQLLIFHPSPFKDCTLYTVEVTGRDKNGSELVPGPVPNPWSFTTAGCGNPYIVSTNPPDGSATVPVLAHLEVVFSEVMSTSSVTWAFSDPGITFSSSWRDETLSLDAATPLAQCTPYSMNITAGSDLSGFPLAPGPVPNPWNFTTICGQPFIVSTAPSHGEVDVALDASIVVAFSEPMNTGSVTVAVVPSFPLDFSWNSPTDTVLTLNHTVPFSACTQYMITILTGEDKAGDPLAPGPVPNPWTFTTACTGPYIVSTSPGHGETNVSVNASIVVTFSEPMAPNATVTMTPAVALNFSWSTDYTVLTLTHSTPFAECVAYRVHVFGYGASGGALQPGPVLNLWSFTTTCPGPVITGTEPQDHEVVVRITAPIRVWFSGSMDNRSVSWTITPDLLLVASWAENNTLLTLDHAVPFATMTQYWVEVRGNDVYGNPLVPGPVPNPWQFGTTCAPCYIVGTVPADGDRGVHPDAPIVVRFSEPADRSQLTWTIAPAAPLSPYWPDDSTLVLTSTPALAPCATYTLEIIVPGLLPGPVPNPWSFTTACLPTVDLSAPGGGEDWTGGSVHDIRWTTADPDDATLTVTLSYSLDGGADAFPHAIASGLVVPTGAGSFPWMLPTVDAGEALVRIEIADRAGNTAADASAAVFTIDSTPPAFLVSLPGDESPGAHTTRAIWFVWTERVDRASFVASFRLSPDPGGLAFAWSVSNLGGDVVLVDHRPLKSKTSYTATFDVTAKDDSDPGNHVPAAVVVRFTTQPPPDLDPPVAKAVGQHQVEVGVPATFDGTGSSGNITDYAWRIADNQGRFVAILVGARVQYTFSENGRYSVTLFVADTNGASDDDTIEIAVTSNPHSSGLLLAGVAGAAALAAALVGATEAGKLAAFQLILFSLYARRKRDDPAERETRGMIRGYVLVHPGDSYTDIKRNLGLGNGTLTYHLTVLEREGVVRSQTRGSRKLFFPREARLPDDGGGLHEVQLRMLRAVRAIPGLAVTDLAGALGISSQLALYHLRDLAAKGRIRFDRRGLRLRCYPSDSTAAPMS